MVKHAVEVDELHVATWEDFRGKLPIANEDHWCFRGALASWNLKTSLERVADQWDVKGAQVPELERRLVREFRRACPQHASGHPVEADDDLGCLALMQHHYAPTRLLDWTYSRYVAAFFALKARLAAAEDCAVVWAIPTASVRRDLADFLTGEARIALPKSEEPRISSAFRQAFMTDNGQSCVASVNPYHLHQRLVAQQGLFLCPRNVSTSFEENLKASQIKPRKIRLCFDSAELGKAFTELRRMNIDDATLFPGIDGFASSLVTRARHLLELPLLKSESA